MKIKMVKKLSIATVVPNRKVALSRIENDQESIKLFSLEGKVTGTKYGESSYGGWVSFLGFFKAIQDDEATISSVCFIPEPLSGLIEDRMNSGIKLVEFGIDVHMKRRDDLDIGYEYSIVWNQDEDALIKSISYDE